MLEELLQRSQLTQYGKSQSIIMEWIRFVEQYKDNIEIVYRSHPLKHSNNHIGHITVIIVYLIIDDKELVFEGSHVGNTYVDSLVGAILDCYNQLRSININ